MSFPKQVRIGWVQYAVVDDVDLNLEGASGQIRYLKDEIALMPNLAPQAKLFVLWHEMVHGILTLAGTDDHDEQTVNKLAHGIIQVLKDNPDLVAITLEDVAHEPSTRPL